MCIRDRYQRRVHGKQNKQKIKKSHKNMDSKKVLTLETLAEPIKASQYGVRGSIVKKAQALDEELQAGKSFPFKKLTFLNIGNPQALGQPPISFNRQVLACLLDTSLIEKGVFPADIGKRAKEYLKHMPGIGAYTDGPGMKYIRQNVAKFMEKRDEGVKCDYNNIYLGNGAGDNVKVIIEMLLNNKDYGIMIPVPRYPLYSAEIVLRDGQIVGYYLDESKNWQLSMESLQQSYDEATKKGIKVKAIVVINPGNPTGSILDEENIRDIINFCYTKNIMILADEVYQINIYDEKKKFHSLKKVLMNMDEKYRKNLELVSFHSVSKGIQGECGLRGGYMELVNIDPEVQKEIYRLQSLAICSNIIGQIALDLMINPPTLEDGYSQETVNQYNEETSHLLNSLKKRAKIITDCMRSCINISSNHIEGALYSFPSIKLSQKVIEEAKKAQLPPDEFYCCKCLENTGIVVVPGSGFGQVEGTHHFRITILVYDAVELEETMKSFKKFNEEFHKQYE
eukprot:TRINITY_DN76_c0_g2_i1.p1 TRINITY_DN76_c0_g2~~TRINITY_DN76_c0_g2_i1.p1  ORF type:complete len:510 (-),score=78.12 TRINITY_DN76_c0_g2_i1:118-1647(-)